MRHSLFFSHPAKSPKIWAKCVVRFLPQKARPLAVRQPCRSSFADTLRHSRPSGPYVGVHADPEPRARCIGRQRRTGAECSQEAGDVGCLTRCHCYAYPSSPAEAEPFIPFFDRPQKRASTPTLGMGWARFWSGSRCSPGRRPSSSTASVARGEWTVRTRSKGAGDGRPPRPWLYAAQGAGVCAGLFNMTGVAISRAVSAASPSSGSTFPA